MVSKNAWLNDRAVHRPPSLTASQHPSWRVHAERGEEVPSTNDADIYAFTSADVDQGWTGLRPGDIVTFTPSPTATLGKGAAKVRRSLVEICRRRMANAHADAICPPAFRCPPSHAHVPWRSPWSARQMKSACRALSSA